MENFPCIRCGSPTVAVVPLPGRFRGIGHSCACQDCGVRFDPADLGRCCPTCHHDRVLAFARGRRWKGRTIYCSSSCRDVSMS